ncbi:sensor histidine kinase [Flavobacterium sp. 3HN19-14]|uniref:sensor histidine kinase n=1 Tax=Flavobacterium sp. 3HN19-14 TaxID=3448133 RepID=UPI003EE06C58
MNNSLRHGKATLITIHFHEVNGVKTCDYTDNGIGFDVEEAKNKKGLGMKNIESRVEIFNGNINFNSSKDNGLKVTFTF